MRWRIILLALVVVGVSTIPYVVGWAAQTKAQVFGGFVIDLDDSHSYLAVMQQGMRGDWRFVSLYSPEPQRGIWMYTFYILLGHVVRLTGLPPLLVYHSARVVCGILLLVTIHEFARLCLHRRRLAWNALLLASVSSGLGWLREIILPSVPGGVSPPDLWFLDGYTFLAIFTFPHYALAWTLLLAAFGSALSYRRTPKSQCLLLGGGAAFLATALHPTLPVVIGTVVATYGMLLWMADGQFPVRWAVAGASLVLGGGSMAGYLWSVFHSDPVLESWGHTVMATPAFHHMLWGYGLLIPLAAVGGVDLVRRRNCHGVFLIVWATTSLLLGYVPFNMQRRFLEGIHIPISLLAAMGLRRSLLSLAQSRLAHTVSDLGYPRRRAVWLTRSLVIALTAVTNLYLLSSAIVTVGSRFPEFFHSRAEVDTFEWIDNHLTDKDIVLASYGTGNLIPAWTGRRVFVGHWAESVDCYERKRLVATFFSDVTPHRFRTDLVSRYGISHVYLGERERLLGDFDPSSASYLSEVYDREGATIYEVQVGEED